MIVRIRQALSDHFRDTGKIPVAIYLGYSQMDELKAEAQQFHMFVELLSDKRTIESVPLFEVRAQSHFRIA